MATRNDLLHVGDSSAVTAAQARNLSKIEFCGAVRARWFGIATARFHARLTATGRAMGTPHYMSPEQAMGKLVDGRSDLYAVGILLYESLVGFPPFDGADAFSVSYKQVHEAPVAPTQVSSRVPEALSAIVMRCLVKSPAERYARGYDLADALIGFLGAIPAADDAHRSAVAARRLSASPAV